MERVRIITLDCEVKFCFYFRLWYVCVQHILYNETRILFWPCQCPMRTPFKESHNQVHTLFVESFSFFDS